MADRDPRVLAIDAGGTMTDTFIVDGAGSFVVGKAQTTPEDESIGFMESARDALEQWDSSPEESFPRIASGIYSGTAMLNRLLSRTGRNIGAIVTAGNEDYLRIERGIQTYLGFSYSDRLHLATHYHNEPIVPRGQMKGIRGRIDVMGTEVLPLREQDVRDAAVELLDAGVEGICICLLFGYRNAEHRLRRAVRRRSPALARRLKFSYDAYNVYVRGSRADEIAVARVAHRMVHGRRVPVLL